MIRFHEEFLGNSKLEFNSNTKQIKHNKMKWNKRARLLYDTFLEASSLVGKAVFFKSMTQAAKEK